jgi:hypothetical protein
MSLVEDAARLGASSGSIGSLQFGQKAFSTGTKVPHCRHLFISLKARKTPLPSVRSNTASV